MSASGNSPAAGGSTPGYRLLAWVAGLSLVLDQWTKWLALGALTNAFSAPDGSELGFGDKLVRYLTYRHPGHRPAVSVWDNFWHFRYAENPGAAWSFMGNAPDDIRLPFLLGIAIAACVGIVWYYRKSPSQLTRWSLALILGGALGNLFDRIRFGYVIDFIDWHWYDLHWPTFNIADVAIVVGVGIMVLEMFRGEEGAAQKSSSAPQTKKRGGKGGSKRAKANPAQKSSSQPLSAAKRGADAPL